MPPSVVKPKPEPMAGPWNIRPAGGEDRHALADIYMRMRRATFTWVDPGRFQIEDFAVQSQGETVLVCQTHGGEIAGFVSYWEADDFIHMLYVGSEFQGHGVGTALLQALPGWPRRRYRLKCLVKNTRAQRFYQSIGFVISGSGASDEGEYTDMTLGPVVRRR